MELTITKVNRTQRTSPKTNKPYTSLSIQTVEHGGKWLSGFGNASNQHWTEGTKIDVIVEPSAKLDKNGEPYLNFSMPKAVEKGMNPEALNEIKVGISMLNQRLDRIERLLSTPKEPEISPSDVPF